MWNRRLSAVCDRKERCGCAGWSGDTCEQAVRSSCEGDQWHPWISKENKEWDSGEVWYYPCANHGTEHRYKSSWSSPFAFCIALDTPVKNVLNYNSRKAGGIVTQMDYLSYEVRLRSIICLALASWTNEGTGYSRSFYTWLGLNSKNTEKLSQKIASAQDQIV